MLSSRVQQAVSALVHLARSPTCSHTTDEIAAAIGCAPCTLAKVLPLLREAGFVGTQRGIGGGVRLCCDPRCVTAWDVVRAVAAHPPAPLPNEPALCQCLEQRLAAILSAAERLLRETTIEELVVAATTLNVPAAHGPPHDPDDAR